MATCRRGGRFIAAVYVLISHLSPLVGSFSPRAIRPKPGYRCRWRGADDGSPYQSRWTASRSIEGGGITLVEMTVSASTTENGGEASPTSASVEKPVNGAVMDMPWSAVQEWALKDNLAKFTVVIPPPIAGGQAKRCAMWRTLAREVPELAGYPIPFLQEMHQQSMKRESATDDTTAQETPGVLPMVDDFEFTSEGGVAGRAYGLPGIADGTRIQTPSLVSAETTVPLGYVTTQGDSGSDGVGFSYELGTCASSSVYSLDGTERSAALAAARRLAMEGAVDTTKQVAAVAKDAAVTGSGLLTDTEANQDLVYLGGATAMLLASATAVGMLSHHLTVNVFWV